MVSFLYTNNVIEYNPGKITNYDEATEASNHVMYAIYLMQAALRLNGYTDEQIQTFFASEDNQFDYDINGIEINEVGEAEEFTSSDGSSSITITPMSVRIDVSKANLNTPDDDPFEPTETTVEDVVEALQSDSDFTRTEYDGKVVYENEVYNDDEAITIYHTYYWEDYHNVLLNCEDDILVYEDGEIESYDDAESVGSHHMFVSQILMIALEKNGYTIEQIQDFFSSEDSTFDYALNGIEFKEIGDSKTYTSLDGTATMTVSPMSIKINLAKANLKAAYEFIEGENQSYVLGEDGTATFRIDADFSLFENGGAVYVDGIETNEYTARSGSTIITLAKEFMNSLSEGEHTLKVAFNNGKSSETKFTVAKTNAVEEAVTEAITTEVAKQGTPKTGDDIKIYILIFVLSGIGIVVLKRYI